MPGTTSIRVTDLRAVIKSSTHWLRPVEPKPAERNVIGPTPPSLRRQALSSSPRVRDRLRRPITRVPPREDSRSAPHTRTPPCGRLPMTLSKWRRPLKKSGITVDRAICKLYRHIARRPLSIVPPVIYVSACARAERLATATKSGGWCDRPRSRLAGGPPSRPRRRRLGSPRGATEARRPLSAARGL